MEITIVSRSMREISSNFPMQILEIMATHFGKNMLLLKVARACNLSQTNTLSKAPFEVLFHGRSCSVANFSTYYSAVAGYTVLGAYIRVEPPMASADVI